MSTVRTDLKRQELIGRYSLSPESPWIILDRPHTIVAAGLTPDIEVHFQMAVVKAGQPGEICGCLVAPPKPSDIERVEWLVCPCFHNDKIEHRRLTVQNQFMVLDSPWGAPVRAVLVYAGSGLLVEDESIIQDIHIVAYINSEVPAKNAAEQGCPTPKPLAPSFRFPCEGYGFYPNDPNRDPRATEELSDCNGRLLAYIYPQAYSFANTPIVDCKGRLLGFAVNGNHGDCELICKTPSRAGEPKVVAVIKKNGIDYLVFDDGSRKPLL